MFATLLAILNGIACVFRSQRDLTIENLALRQQFAIYERTVPRTNLRAFGFPYEKSTPGPNSSRARERHAGWSRN